MRLFIKLHDHIFICFNPRICKRCDLLKMPSQPTYQVSIHASVKDATDFSLFGYGVNKGFNPRICKRCDSTYTSVCLVQQVSIHASVKDATPTNDRHVPKAGFNPRICKRCDITVLSLSITVCSFNPRICKRCDFHFFYCLC